MRRAKIIHEDGKTVIDEPEFIDCLFNTGELAVDGETYSGVVQVTFNE